MANYKCISCESVFEISADHWKCDCGGIFDVIYDKPTFYIDESKSSLWRYKAMLPIDHMENIIDFQEGMTPLIKRELEGKSVYIKLDFMFPTGSFKDRGAAILVSKMKEMGVTEVVEDSSGNAGASIAGYCAAAQIKCNIYLPAATSKNKIKQIAAYGAEIIKIEGSRDKTAEAVLSAAENTYYASHSYNPLFFEGTKTLAFEIWEQLGKKVPDSIIVPCGNGTMLLGVYYGFKQLMALEQSDKMPKIYAVQSVNCAPLHDAYHNKETCGILPTIAEGISVGTPIRREQILKAVQETKGDFIAVTDEAVEDGLQTLYQMGIYAEPTSATVIAAYQQLMDQKAFNPEDICVLPLTGNGLKKA